MSANSEVVITTNKTIILTDIRLKIVQALADGMTRKEIAKKFKRNIRTVEWDLNSMRFLFGAPTLYALIAVMFRKGLIK